MKLTIRLSVPVKMNVIFRRELPQIRLAFYNCACWHEHTRPGPGLAALVTVLEHLKSV